MSEDCLYLNIFFTLAAADENLPRILGYIHGGAACRTAIATRWNLIRSGWPGEGCHCGYDRLPAGSLFRLSGPSGNYGPDTGGRSDFQFRLPGSVSWRFIWVHEKYQGLRRQSRPDCDLPDRAQGRAVYRPSCAVPLMKGLLRERFASPVFPWPLGTKRNPSAQQCR